MLKERESYSNLFRQVVRMVELYFFIRDVFFAENHPDFGFSFHPGILLTSYEFLNAFLHGRKILATGYGAISLKAACFSQ